MRCKIILLLLFFTFSLLSQEKGVSPINEQQITTNQSTYAVVVGISDYQDEGIPDLRFADKDAEAFANFLRSPAGGSLDEDHLKVLINQEATQAQFAGALDWLWEVAGENDKAIIYFSGHGDVEKKSLTQPGFLLCWDAPARVYMAGGAFPLNMLQEVISTISVQNKSKVIMVADACRSGKLSGSSVGGSQITGSNLARQYANEIKILSCQPDEYSIEGEQWGGGRGAFSYHLLDGLYGMADGNGDRSVNLLEIGRYLEDKVSTEVAPQSQIPMTVGGKGEKLTDVFPEILAQLKEGRKGQFQLFTSTESRGIEEDVLAAADTNIVEMYAAFKKALVDKRFLEPVNACADYYYEKLSHEPQLERLHSSMLRNYAAALQDDAQQEMNRLLKTGLDDFVLSSKSALELFEQYPDYLERAAELLGSDHYMYATLQARKNLFLGKIQEEKPDARLYYKQALRWQPDMPHAYLELIQAWDKEHPDSAAYYANKAMDQIPSWVVPYTRLASYFEYYRKDYERAEELLNKASEIDSASILVYYLKGNLYFKKREYPEAEKWLLKAIKSTTNDICFPCAYNKLGGVYFRLRKYEPAEEYLNKAIAIDSTFGRAYGSLSAVYGETNRYDKAKSAAKRAVELGYTSSSIYNNLASLTANTGEPEKAIELFFKALEIDSLNAGSHTGLGICYRQLGKSDKAEFHLKKSLSINPDNPYALNTLGIMYQEAKRNPEAEEIFKQILQIDSTHAPAWVNLGEGYMDTRSYTKAEQAYRNALKINYPFAHPYAHDGLGELYMETGDFDQADKEFNAALSLNPNHLQSTVNLIRLYIRTEQLEKADSLSKIVLEQQPELPEAHFFMALVARKHDKYEEAWAHLEKGFELGLNQESLGFQDIHHDPKFEEMQKDARWQELIKKYFPDEKED